MVTTRDGTAVARVILSLVLSPCELVDTEVDADAVDAELDVYAVTDVELEATELNIQITLLVSVLSG
jgi:hypothetical protein